MSSLISSGWTSVRSHECSHLGFGASAGRPLLSTAGFRDLDEASLLLKTLEKKGMVGVRLWALARRSRRRDGEGCGGEVLLASFFLLVAC